MISFYLKGVINVISVDKVRHYTYLEEEGRLVIYDGSTVKIENVSDEMFWSIHKIISEGKTGYRFNIMSDGEQAFSHPIRERLSE